MKQQIISLKILPGTALSENEMAIQFKVSRTPVRESFVRLAQEGLVQVLPQRGTLVSLIDRSLVEEARFMRLQLECAIIQLACNEFPETTLQQVSMNLSQQLESMKNKDTDNIFKLDQQFHYLLFAGVKKTHTWNTMNLLTIHLDRSRKLRLLDDNDWEEIYDQHSQIFEAIKRKDTTIGAHIMREHLNRGVDELDVLNQKYPNYFT